MGDIIEQFLKAAPEQPTRSKLEPYRDLIRELRRRRYTYRKIAAVLQDSFQLNKSKSAVNDFVKANSKPRRLLFEIPAATPQTRIISAAIPPSAAASTSSSRPAAPNAPPKLFHFDPAKGLTLSDEDLNLKPKKD